MRALEWGIILVTCHSNADIMEWRLVCPSRASGERSCITLPVADWAAQTEALEAACPVGAAHQAGLCTDSLATNAGPRAPMSQGSCGGCLRHRQAYLRVGLAQNPTPGSLPLQTSNGGTRCLPPRESSSVCLQSPGLAQAIWAHTQTQDVPAQLASLLAGGDGRSTGRPLTSHNAKHFLQVLTLTFFFLLKLHGKWE